MTKILAYYSLILVTLSILLCLFANNGDFEIFIGGIIFIPVMYSIWEMTKELEITDKRDKQFEKIKEEEILRKQIRKKLENEEEVV